jgi:alpha-beta hydrolase superfamily lysophospholipase
VALLAAATPGFAAAQAVSSEVQVERGLGVLAGTLLVPATTRPVPVVLVIAGSGPTNRDGNSVGLPQVTNAYKQLAESLAVRGIASLRYDKRGIGGSGSAAVSEVDLRFDTLAADAAAWIRQLRKDSRFSRVIVLGHSEGALLGLLATREAPVDGYVSLAGPARRADQVLQDQLLASQLSQELRAQSDSIIAELVRGRTVSAVAPALASLFRPSVQPYLISWFHYAASDEISRLRIPCLVLQGTSDIQVSPTEAALLRQANPGCDVHMIDGMNHVLKRTSSSRTAQMPSYYNPALPLAPGLVGSLVTFVTALQQR